MTSESVKPISAAASSASGVYRSRLFRRYLLLILTLVCGAILSLVKVKAAGSFEQVVACPIC